MKILVCGGRDYHNSKRIDDVLNSYLNEAEAIIHGAARGADSLAGDWARKNNVKEIRYPADWDKYGRSAGYKRNAAMLTENPDLVIAFPGGRGTAMMIGLARKAGIEVIVVKNP